MRNPQTSILKDIKFFEKTQFPEEALNLQAFLKKTEEKSYFYNRCIQFFTNQLHYPNFLLTKSCTQSLEIAVMSLNLPIGSEIILPSYTFVSLGNAIVQSGLKCIFVDCDKETMNIDTESLESAISDKTRAIIAMNYAGIACNYPALKYICDKHNLVLIEDNAHGIGGKFNGINLGTFGDISTISFDHLKNLSCYEGGGITINKEELMPAIEDAFEMGTDRNLFFNGEVPYYQWTSLGTKANLAEPLSAILFGQIQNADQIFSKFTSNWQTYFSLLKPLADEGFIDLPVIPEYASHNGHIFWIKTNERNELINYLQEHGIHTTFHYYPLHLSKYGKIAGEFRGEDKHTTSESQRLLRLPQHFNICETNVEYIVEHIYNFYKLPFKA